MKSSFLHFCKIEINLGSPLQGNANRSHENSNVEFFMGIKKLHMTKLFEDEVYTKRGSLFFVFYRNAPLMKKVLVK